MPAQRQRRPHGTDDAAATNGQAPCPGQVLRGVPPSPAGAARRPAHAASSSSRRRSCGSSIRWKARTADLRLSRPRPARSGAPASRSNAGAAPRPGRTGGRLVEEVADRHAEDAAQLVQAAGADPVGAALVLLHLLVGDAQQAAQPFLAHAQQQAPLAQQLADARRRWGEECRSSASGRRSAGRISWSRERCRPGTQPAS